MKYVPHDYQKRALAFLRREIPEAERQERSAGLWMRMGLGKTVVAATAVEMMLDELSARKALIVGPLRVVTSVWPDEFLKWDHLRLVRNFTQIDGTVRQREKLLESEAGVHLINYDKLDWLEKFLAPYWPYDLVVLDEASQVKTPSTKRFLAMRRARKQVKTVIELAGIPAPNGLIDLWGPMWFLDGGRRLGRTYEAFQHRWFKIGFTGRLEPLKHTSREIAERVGDICISMKTEDYLELPPRIVNTIRVALPPKAKEVYDQLEDEMYTYLEETEDEFTAFNSASLTNKCRQAANGALYREDMSWAEFHSAKLDALESIVEESGGDQILVGCAFKSDYARIKKRFPFARLLDRDPQTVRDWNAGEIQMLLAHPKSGGHGLNLQLSGAHILVWFSVDWSWDLYEQFNCRLDRQGQVNSVVVHHILAEDTIDESVLRAVMEKKKAGEILHENMKRRKKK